MSTRVKFSDKFWCTRCCQYRANELLGPKRKYTSQPMCKKCDETVHAKRLEVDERNRMKIAALRPAIPYGD